ncbi:MAG: hypothetical protein J7J86_02655 [Bacteroidales bacterium]|nr:hypothetical protein [Bacteroidales bacterium]
MRKIVIFFCLIMITGFLNAQVYLGLNSKIAFPTSNYQEVDNGMGVDLLIGYLLKQKMDFNISISNLWLNSFIENYKISSVKANAKYYILQKSIKPYIDFGLGYFHKSFNGPFDKKFAEKGIGIIPSAGILFDLKIFNGLFLNTEFSYCKVLTEHKVSLIGFNIGILYYFESKK